MMRSLTLALATASLLAAGIADAQAFQRSGTTSGPRGSGSYSASASCSGGTCSRNVARTGAAGKSMTHSGSITNNGNGTYSTSGTTTGPYGQTRTRTGTITVGQ